MISRARREASVGCWAIVILMPCASCRPRNADRLAPNTVAFVTSSKVAAVPELRQLWPESGNVVLSTRVGFRWLGASSHIDLSRTRSFDKGFRRLDGSAVSSDPQVLTASTELLDGVWFWRVGAAVGSPSPIWNFRVRGVKDGASLPDGADINCDGLADILLKGEVVLGGNPSVRLHCQLGPTGVNELKPASDREVPDWGQLVSIGDIDGDGCDDAVATATPILHGVAISRVPVPILFRGQSGLSSNWQAARRLNHHLSPIGDLNRDGYADAAECTASACAVFAGGADVQERPFLMFKNYDLLLGGDFDADGLPDLWAVGRATTGQGYIDFFAGKSTISSTPSSSLTMPQGLIGPPAAGVIVNGKSALLGFATNGPSDSLWRATASRPATTVLPWLTMVHAAGGWPHLWRISTWQFVPFTGPAGRGILVVIPTRSNSDWDPTQSFLQYGFSATGTPLFLGRLTTPGLEHLDGVNWFVPIGDTNGDGYDDLLVHATDDNLGGDLWFEYTGSATGFTYKTDL